MNKILVIIPAYNEGRNIRGVIRDVGKNMPGADIAVINDCSTDDTEKEAQDAGALVLSLPVRLNYGATIQTGFRYAALEEYDIIVLLDGDGQHDASYIPEMVKRVRDGESDIVIGSRFSGETGYRMPVFRRLGSLFFSLLIRLITGRTIHDPTSGYQVFNSAVNRLYTSEHFPEDYPDADVMLLLILRRMRIFELPMKMRRSEGKSMHGFFSSFYYFFKMLISILMTLLRLKP